MVLETAKQFSEKERAYDAYQARQNYLRMQGSISRHQQELEEARRELEEKQQQRDEAFREAERENAALPEEEEKQKKPAGSKAADAAPTELVLPQREARTGSPVRYILIGALLAGALCIAIYLFTHPAREDDPADETKS